MAMLKKSVGWLAEARRLKIIRDGNRAGAWLIAFIFAIAAAGILLPRLFH